MTPRVHHGQRDVNGRLIDIHPKSDVIYLLAYPRSGGTWFCNCFEFITKRFTRSRHAEWQTGARAPALLYHTHTPEAYNLSTLSDEDINSNDSFNVEVTHKPFSAFDLFTSSSLTDSHDEPTKPTKNILLLRNYNEAIASHLYNYRSTFDKWPGLENQDPLDPSEIAGHQHGPMYSQESELTKYMRLIETHDKFSKQNQETSLLLYYEDFITDPYSVLIKVIDYLEKNFSASEPTRIHSQTCQSRMVSDRSPPCATSDFFECYDETVIPSSEKMKHNLDELMENFEYHKNISMDVYRKESGLGLSTTKSGSNLSFYSSIVSKEFLLEMDKRIKENPEFFNKYLSHYEDAHE